MAIPTELTANTIFGNYRIERLLGRGGMGAVYAAEQLDDGRQVAIKVLASGLDSDADRERFIREGRVAASINHPNTVYVYRTEEIEGTPTITMELVDGGTLEQKVERNGPLPVVDAVHDTLQIIDGLDAAQREGILHRDVKPANCFVGPSGEIKVGDFGLSRPVDQVDQMRLTQTGMFLGTPVFSSPEQLLGDTLDLRSDIYAVGATLYFLLTGKFPYEADNAARLIAIVMSAAPTPLAAHRSDIPAALQSVVLNCLARSRDKRYADYASLRAELVSLLPSTIVPAPLGARAVAGMLDSFLTFVVGYALIRLSSIAHAWPTATTTRVYQIETVRDAVLEMLLSLVIIGSLEGTRGWSPGKLTLGLRVIGLDGGVPGLRRAFARAALVSIPTLLAAFIIFVPESQSRAEQWSTAVTFGGLALLFLRVRQSNGFASEHDRITKTRVVRKTSAHSRTHHEPAKTSKLPVISVGAPRIGPFEVAGTLAASSNVFVGIDAQLKRAVWIVRNPPGTPHVTATVRSISRETAVRWIAGARNDEDTWDAYAAVPGCSFRARMDIPIKIAEMIEWLRDLATELFLMRDAASALRAHSISNVWISEDGRAILLPFSLDDGAEPGGPLLRQVVNAFRDTDGARRNQNSWPIQTRVLLDRISNSADDIASVKHALDRSEIPPPITFNRRLALISATLTVPLVLAASIALAGITDMSGRKNDERISDLIQYTRRRALPIDSDSTEISRDSLFLRRGFTARFARPGSASDSHNTFHVPTTRSQTKVATYVVAHYRDDIISLTSNRQTILTARELRIADSLVRAFPQISVEQSRAADNLVDSVWHGKVPGATPRWRKMWMVSIVACGLGALIISVLVALFARRGAPSRLLHIEFVSQNGEPANRVALIVRHVLVWTPILILLFAAPSIVDLSLSPGGSLLAAVCAVLIALNFLSMYRTPSSSLVDRLTQMHVVPE